jgi:hypothetical protein
MGRMEVIATGYVVCVLWRWFHAHVSIGANEDAIGQIVDFWWESQGSQSGR